MLGQIAPVPGAARVGEERRQHRLSGAGEEKIDRAF